MKKLTKSHLLKVSGLLLALLSISNTGTTADFTKKVVIDNDRCVALHELYTSSIEVIQDFDETYSSVRSKFQDDVLEVGAASCDTYKVTKALGDKVCPEFDFEESLSESTSLSTLCTSISVLKTTIEANRTIIENFR